MTARPNDTTSPNRPVPTAAVPGPGPLATRPAGEDEVQIDVRAGLGELGAWDDESSQVGTWALMPVTVRFERVDVAPLLSAALLTLSLPFVDERERQATLSLACQLRCALRGRS